MDETPLSSLSSSVQSGLSEAPPAAPHLAAISERPAETPAHNPLDSPEREYRPRWHVARRTGRLSVGNAYFGRCPCMMSTFFLIASAVPFLDLASWGSSRVTYARIAYPIECLRPGDLRPNRLSIKCLRPDGLRPNRLLH